MQVLERLYYTVSLRKESSSMQYIDITNTLQKIHSLNIPMSLHFVEHLKITTYTIGEIHL